MDEALMEDEELMFDSITVEKMITDAVSNALGEKLYDRNQVTHWINKIAESILHQLTAMNKPFKYIVTVAISQKCGAALVSNAVCFWDSVTDGHARVLWTNDTIQTVITVFGLRL